MEIQEGVVLEQFNLLSFRKEMTQKEVVEKSREIEELIKREGAERIAPVMSTTYAVRENAGDSLMDIEILVPLNKRINFPVGYQWKERLFVTNAVLIKHKGHPAGLQNTFDILNEYMQKNQLTPITGAYNVTVKEAKNPMEVNNMEIDIYVGISPNVL